MNQSFDRDFDPYKTLCVSSTASADEIKQAYRRLAKKYHPDRCGGDKANESRFKEVSSAYEVLSNREKRGQYDALRSGAGTTGGHIDLGDLFSQIFGGGGGMGGMGGMGGNGNTRYRVVNEPFGGGGFGGSPFGGFGGTSFGTNPAASQHRQRSPKPSVPVEKTVQAKDGSKVTLRGANIYSDVRIDVGQAILGAVVQVPTLDGNSSVKVPPGTSSGNKLRLKGKGARKSNGARGNHMVTVHIDVPKDLDEKAEQLLTEFMSQIGSD